MTEIHGSIWGRPCALPVHTTATVELGHLRVWLERHDQEWRAEYARDDSVAEPASEIRIPAVLPKPTDGHATRYAAPPQHGYFVLRPRLADRPVVVRPETPLRVLAGCDVDVYVSTPLWVAFYVTSNATTTQHQQRPASSPHGDELEIFEVPVVRPPDTWFGATTIDGELAYISKTSARLAFDELPLKPGRAVTRIRVRNQTREPVTLERVLLPAPELQLYIDPASNLWTQAVKLELTESGVADIRYPASPPIQSTKAVPIGQPRRVEPKHLLVRALSAFWS